MIAARAGAPHRLQLRSHCGLCGARAWTPTVADRIAFLDRHNHDVTPWAPDPPAEPQPVRWWPGWAIVAVMLAVTLLAVLVA